MSEENIKLLGGIVSIALALWPFFANFLDARQRERIEGIAATAAKAAELYGRTNPEADKYSIALNEAMKMGQRHRAKLRVDDWFPYIEKAVYDLKMAGGELPKQVDSRSPQGAVRADNSDSLR